MVRGVLMATDDVKKEFASIRLRLDAQDKILMEIRGLLAAAKIGTTVVRWAAVVGAALATIWAAIHGDVPKI